MFSSTKEYCPACQSPDVYIGFIHIKCANKMCRFYDQQFSDEYYKEWRTKKEKTLKDLVEIFNLKNKKPKKLTLKIKKLVP